MNRIRIHYLLFANYLFREIISQSTSFSRIQFKFTLNTLSVSRNHFIFIMFFANSVQIHYLFHEIILNFYLLREFNSNALFILRIRIDSTIFFANPLQIHNLLYEFTLNSLSFSRIHYGNSLFNIKVHLKFTETAWLERPWSI